MISKAKIKFIKSLQIKKYRKQEQCFVVEGAKSVQELFKSPFQPQLLVGTHEFLSEFETVAQQRSIECIEATAAELAGMGNFQSNTAGLAVAKTKPNEGFTVAHDEFVLVLDDIRDPGNLGTIIRTADWYGITKIVASPETADFYNPKVISATMGSFTRVLVYYTDLVPYLGATGSAVYGAFLNGEDIHTLRFSGGGFVVIGNESNGISAPVEKLVGKRITIPRYGRAESLNAAVATAVICDHLRSAQKND